MYENFYGFKEKPFSLLPDPSFLYLGERHSTAFAMLEYGLLSQAGFTVITGEVGSGKTTLVRHLLNQIHENVTVGLISNTHQEMDNLLQWVLLAFEQEYSNESRVAQYDAFARFLIDQYASNHRTVLIIDEAQNLQPQVLEELRMLSNINSDKHLVLQLILVGQPQLREQLKHPDLLQFRQRVAVSHHLRALGKNDTRAYILHRTRSAGREGALFTKGASDLVYDASSGIPRVINVLCDTALIFGYARKRRRIDTALIQTVLQEMADTGALPAEDFKIEKTAEPARPVAPVVRKVAEFDKESARQLFSSLRNKS